MSNTPIYIIGQGNLGWHLQQLFEKKNLHLVDWYSSRIPFSDLKLKEQSIVFLTIKDDVIEEKIIELINLNKNLILVYCSGSMDLVSKYPNQVICWYPLFSFTKGIDVDWGKVPVFTEILNEKLSALIDHLNNELELNSLRISAEQRQKLHVSAVFINNFTTACAIAADSVLNDHKLFEYLIPILNQTIEKISQSSTNLIDLQTGPAKRGDRRVIQKHLELLNTLALENELYKSITQYIQQKIK